MQHDPLPYHLEKATMIQPSNTITYTAAGGVVTDASGTRVLLLVRPSRDEVRLPKGHVEPDEDTADTALREVSEETGYDDIELVLDLGEQLIAFPFEGKIVLRTEHYYLMRARSEHQIARPPADDQQFFPIWVEWEEALQHLSFEAEQEWARRARKALNQAL